MIISEMWAHEDPETKARLQLEHDKNRMIAALEREEYEATYGCVVRKRKIRRKRGKNVYHHNYLGPRPALLYPEQ